MDIVSGISLSNDEDHSDDIHTMDKIEGFALPPIDLSIENISSCLLKSRQVSGPWQKAGCTPDFRFLSTPLPPSPMLLCSTRDYLLWTHELQFYLYMYISGEK